MLYGITECMNISYQLNINVLLPYRSVKVNKQALTGSHDDPKGKDRVS